MSGRADAGVCARLRVPVLNAIARAATATLKRIDEPANVTTTSPLKHTSEVAARRHRELDRSDSRRPPAFACDAAGTDHCRRLAASAVPYVPALDDEDDVFGDVRGVIADSLEVSRDQNEIDRRLHRAGIAQHVGEQI